MAITFKAADKLGTYRIENKLDYSDAHWSRYQGTDATHGSATILQYHTPGTGMGCYRQYVDSRKEVLRAIAASPVAQEHVLQTRELLHGIEVRGRMHDEMLLVSEPIPESLSTQLSSIAFSGSTRLDLARKIARGVVALHEAAVIWTMIDPGLIGVRADGSVAFLDFICARLAHDYGTWDWPIAIQQYAYVAPEVIDGDDASEASDIYSLARTVAVLLMSDSHLKAAEQIAVPDFGSIEFRSDLPEFDRERVRGLLSAALSDDPRCRPTAVELCSALHGTNEPSTATKQVDVPRWLRDPLQSLAFWVAYQHQVYRHHPLPEGAIVAELTRLVDAELASERSLVREVMYREIASQAGAGWGDGSRCDMAVLRTGADDEPGEFEAAIEVKRSWAAESVLDEDLIALHQLRQANPGIRAFLVIVSQAGLPSRWVSHLGTANRAVDPLKFSETCGEASQSEIRLRVRRVAKAAHSFKLIDKATYCCLIEVD